MHGGGPAGGPPARYGQRWPAIIKLFLSWLTRRGLVDERSEEGVEWEGYPTGYKCRQGVSLDRGRPGGFNHDPSYIPTKLAPRIPKQTFPPRY